MEECQRMGIPVKGPDINESDVKFTVNKKGEIRYALSAIKGVGEAAVESIVLERKNKGPFKNLFDVMRRMNLRTMNKKVLESLAWAGAFDGMGIDRAMFFATSEKYDSFIEHLIKYGAAHQGQQASTQNSLFGSMSEEVSVREPALPRFDPWSLIQKLEKEREVTGIFLSGHPLDDYKMEIQNFTTCSLDKIENYKTQKIKVAGFVIKAEHRISQRGTGWGKFTVQDYSGTLDITLFNEDYQKYKHLFEAGAVLYLQGTYESRWNSGEMQFRLTDVRQLASISGTMTESITIKFPLERITETLVASVDDLCQRYKGEHALKMMFLDFENKTSLNLVAKTRKVNATNEFITELEKLGVEYKLN